MSDWNFSYEKINEVGRTGIKDQAVVYGLCLDGGEIRVAGNYMFLYTFYYLKSTISKTYS